VLSCRVDRLSCYLFCRPAGILCFPARQEESISQQDFVFMRQEMLYA